MRAALLTRIRRYWIRLLVIVWALLLQPEPAPTTAADGAAAVVRVSASAKAVMP